MCNGILYLSYDTICAKHRLNENLLNRQTYKMKIYCLTVCSRNCVRVTVTVNESTPQLADSTEFVMVGSAWLRSGVPLKVFHVWDFPRCQHSAAARLLLKCTQLKQNVSFMSPQPHNSTMDTAFLSYKFSDGLNVDVFGVWYKICVCGMGSAGLGKVLCLVFCKHYSLLRYVIAGNIVGVYSK